MATIPTSSAKLSVLRDLGANARARQTLADLRPGQIAIVQEPSSDPQDAAVLRAMGLRPHTRVRLCRTGEPCIVSILNGSAGPCGEGCRIGLAGTLAQRVVVELE